MIHTHPPEQAHVLQLKQTYCEAHLSVMIIISRVSYMNDHVLFHLSNELEEKIRWEALPAFYRLPPTS